MEPTDAYELFFSQNTRELMESYVLKMRDKKTRGAYLKVYGRFAEHVKKDWFDCGPSDFKSFIAAQAKLYDEGKITYTTYAKYYKIIAAFSRHCYKLAHAEIPSPLVPAGYEDYATAARVKAPLDEFHPQKIPPLTDVEKVIGIARKRDKLVYFAILFSLGTFLKTSEFMSLTTRDLMQDAEGKWAVRLSDGYMVLISGDFGTELADYVTNSLMEGDPIFSDVRKNGTKPIAHKTLMNRLLNTCRAAGVESFTFNELRNAAAVYTKSAGATNEEIATSMRYKTPAHIERLGTLILPQRNDASRFIHFTLDKEDGAEEDDSNDV